MIALGYIVTFVYMALVILVGEIIQKKFNTNKEMTRKCEHLATSASWAIAYLFFGPTYHLIIVNFGAFVVLTLITFTGFMKSAEREDADKSYGLFYFGLSTFLSITIAVLIDSSLVALTGIAYYCLALADGLAPITAKLFGKANFLLYEPKTFVGFATVFIVSSAACAVFNSIFDLNYSFLFIVSVGAVSAHAELYGKKGFDNVTVNFSVFLYLLLNHYGYITEVVQVALLIALLFTLISAKSKSLSYAGGVASFVYLFLTSMLGHVSLTSMIFILFFVEAIISKLTTKVFNKRYASEKKEKHSRGMFQILANSLAPLVCAGIYYFTKNEIFLLGAIAALAEEFSDSVASDVGRLSIKLPRDILRFKKLSPGVSGGVSLLGFGSSLVAAFVASAIAWSFGVVDLKKYLVLSGIVFLGTVIDSVLGSLIQVLYKCPSCDKLTESTTHCETETVKVKGIKIINNSTVNLLSGIITAAIAIGIFYLM